MRARLQFLEQSSFCGRGSYLLVVVLAPMIPTGRALSPYVSLEDTPTTGWEEETAACLLLPCSGALHSLRPPFLWPNFLKVWSMLIISVSSPFPLCTHLQLSFISITSDIRIEAPAKPTRNLILKLTEFWLLSPSFLPRLNLLHKVFKLSNSLKPQF